ncbi:MAG: hypothetical protein AAGL24_14545 [Pseudomonadota bacterium]
MKKKIIVAFAAMISALVALTPTASRALPISIDFTFSSFSASFNGSVRETGDVSLKLLLDTTTPNLGRGFGSFSNAYAVDAFVTAPDLDLDNTKIVSDTFLYFGNDVVGITDGIPGVTSNAFGDFSTIWTAAEGGNLEFDRNYDLATLFVPQAPVSKSATEFRAARGWQFANGSQFDPVFSNAVFRNRRNTVSVSIVEQGPPVAPVPLPASLPLLLAAFGGAVLLVRRANAR